LDIGAQTYGMSLVYYVNMVIKTTFFIYTQSRLVDPCMLLYKVIVYRIVNFIWL